MINQQNIETLQHRIAHLENIIDATDAKALAFLQSRVDTLTAERDQLIQKNTALVAENAVILQDRAVILKELDDTCFEIGMLEEKSECYPLPSIPTTEAAIAAIRAEGVEMFADMTEKVGEQEEFYDNDESALMLKYTAKQARLFAAQLRQEGVQS